MSLQTKQSRQERLAAKNAFDGSLVYGTGNFNRRTGRDRHLDQRQRVRNFFVDEQNGLLRTDIREERPCPSCEATDPTVLFLKDGFPHGRCSSCGLVYVAPIITEEAVMKFYEKESSWTEVLFSEEQVDLDVRKFVYGLDLIEENCLSGRILDIGCGPGFFLQEARERGWLVEGMEMNERCVERLKQLDIPVCTDPLEHSDLEPETFNAVAMWEVLEHLRHPRQALDQVYNLLKPGGILLICVPNFASLVNRIMHEKAGTFAGYSHVNFFEASTLKHLQEECGFDVIEMETVITELGTINNYLNFANPYLGDSELALPLLTPDYIHENLLGSRLLSLAVKEG
jgi:2-polyprenyl-3-methyl-5-hydroxy-6-metoxy-1,4-benzoquinol methylase